MGYIIDIALNLLKNSSEKDTIVDLIKETECNFYYEMIDFNEKHDLHSIITVGFQEENQNMLGFLRHVKGKDNIYIESIYDDNQDILLYASTYYRTKYMDKKSAKKYKEERKTRSYSETDLEILSIMS